jgi:CBS domain containing-hemolysin-like protein
VIRPPDVLAVGVDVGEAALVGVIVVLFVVSCVLAMAETALTRVSKPKAQALAETAGGPGTTLLGLVESQDWVNPVLLLTLICQMVEATLAGVLADRLFGVWGLVVATLVNVGVFFVVAEVAPKTWAIQHTELVALAAARPVRMLAGFPPLRLLSRGLIGLTNVILPGKGLKAGPFVSEEELLAVTDLAHEESVIDDDERAIIANTIDFGDTYVREVMVPRPDMVTVNSDFRIVDAIEVAILNGYSRFPVCGEGIDDIVGIIYVKDLMRAQRDGRGDEPVTAVMRRPTFVPETKRVTSLLREIQGSRTHLAIVVDEYGGVAGLVTLEDILEELVGEIRDEYDVEEAGAEELPGGALRVDARMNLEDVGELLGDDLPEGDWDSVGGLLIGLLGHVPAEGESAMVDGWMLEAERVRGRRVEKVMLRRATPAPEPGGSVRVTEPVRERS